MGKNKLADRLLELLGREREYIQLHRDTTVQTLTLVPTLKDGVIVWEDSPLVRAVKYGRVLMVDEADKVFGTAVCCAVLCCPVLCCANTLCPALLLAHSPCLSLLLLLLLSLCGG